MRLGEVFTEQAAAVQALDSAADILVLRPDTLIEVVRWGVLVSVLLDNTATPLQAELDHTTHDSAGAATRSAGSGGQNLREAAVDRVVGSVVIVEPTSRILVRPGDFLSFQVSQGAVAGNGFPFIQYVKQNWAKEPLVGQRFSADLATRIFDASTAI